MVIYEAKMNKVTWLHISDLHLRPLQAYDSDMVLKKLLEDVEKCIKNDSLHPDFIILSGDISYSSKPEEYELARGFLDKLLEISGLDKDRIFIVPGNHDVDRDSITPGARVMTDGIDSRDSVNKILDNGVDREFIFKRFINYSNFINIYMGERRFLFDNEHYYYVKNIPVDNLNLSILGLNSSWLSGSDNDQGKLVLGDMQVQKALAEVENADICIAMMHHPFDWFRKFDRSDVESSLSEKCAFVLHGHLHEQSINHISGPGRSSTVIGAGACFEKRTSFNSYNFVQLNLDDGKGRIHLRMYSDKDSGFWTNDTITYKGAPNGVYEFPLPSDICKASVEERAIGLQKSNAKINSQFTRLIGIPLKPQPYFAHFFHLHSNFTGRTNELKALCDWFNDNKDSVIVLNAIGGMGKSSLAWYWLKECVNSSSNEGIIWWSFYEGESSFTKFLNDAIIYLSGKEIDPGDIGSNYEKTRIVINLLGERKFLLILDGFERQLGTYEDQRDSYTEEDIAEARACIDPNAALFLRDQAASFPNSKILITSRIKIRDLEDETGKPLEGCREEELRSFKEDDAYVFMQSQGVKGTRSEILSACEPYRCHPLSLRLLSGLIIRDLRDPGDILVAPRYDVYSDLKARRHHIMEVAFNSLPEKLKKLLSNAAAFRSTITYEALLKFNDYEHEQEFEEGLKELIDFGLILFNKNDGRFDMHPIVRKYAYQRLANKESIHLKLRDYFMMNIPQTKKTQSMEEISPVIEIYYHSAKAGLFDEAYNLYRNRLSKLLFFRFGAYQTIIVLLQLLFENPSDNVPNLKNYKAQISAMNDLAGAYDRMGHARQAVDILENVFKIIKEKGDIAPINYRLNFFLISNHARRIKAGGERSEYPEEEKCNGYYFRIFKDRKFLSTFNQRTISSCSI